MILVTDPLTHPKDFSHAGAGVPCACPRPFSEHFISATPDQLTRMDSSSRGGRCAQALMDQLTLRSRLVRPS